MARIRDLVTTTSVQFAFHVGAADGQTVTVQGSEDLIHWDNLQTNTVAGA